MPGGSAGRPAPAAGRPRPGRGPAAVALKRGAAGACPSVPGGAAALRRAPGEGERGRGGAPRRRRWQVAPGEGPREAACSAGPALRPGYGLREKRRAENTGWHRRSLGLGPARASGARGDPGRGRERTAAVTEGARRLYQWARVLLPLSSTVSIWCKRKPVCKTRSLSSLLSQVTSSYGCLCPLLHGAQQPGTAPDWHGREGERQRAFSDDQQRAFSDDQ